MGLFLNSGFLCQKPALASPFRTELYCQRLAALSFGKLSRYLVRLKERP